VPAARFLCSPPKQRRVTILRLTLRIFRLFPQFKWPIRKVALFICLYKFMELTIPLLGAWMINSLQAHRPTMTIWGIACLAFCVWVLHGSVLGYFIDYTEGKRFSLPARQYLSIYALSRILGKKPEDVEEDPALMQVIIERGETVTVDWAVSIIRVVIPLTLPFLFVLTMLFTSSLILGTIVFVGAFLNGCLTWRLNTKLAPAFRTLRDLHNRQGQRHFTIFAGLIKILKNSSGRHEELEAYQMRFAEFTTARIDTLLQYLGFNFRRGVVINITHLLTWLTGIWYVNEGVYQVGYLLVFLRWETLVFDFLSAYFLVHKQWLETSPAIVAFFAQLDEASVIVQGVVR
jgi:ABC-type multidrug transport system fused ATPase/permease subunit